MTRHVERRRQRRAGPAIDTSPEFTTTAPLPVRALLGTLEKVRGSRDAEYRAGDGLLTTDGETATPLEAMLSSITVK